VAHRSRRRCLLTRTAADLGRGLAPARVARAIQPGERIHVVGAAGAGASAAALHAHWAGAIVTGCDPGGPSPYTPALEAAGISLEWHHDPAHVTAPPHPDRLAVTKALTSIDPGNAELATAHDLGIPVEPWQQVVADAAFGRTLVAVAGTHGKSTTAGWLTHVLGEAGMDPAAFVGALLPASITGGTPATARRGRGAAFVVEADEYAGNFDAFRPDLVVITNIDWDHPDLFADRTAVVDAIANWLARSPRATLVANVDDLGVRELLERLGPWAGQVSRTGLDVDSGSVDLGARIDAATPDGTRIAVTGLGSDVVEMELPLVGRHNVANALGVAGAASSLGLRADVIARATATFPGVGRRLERKGEAAGVVVYDDYGHHPTAIRATLAAVRQREPGRRVWAAYEPLTYHRTAALLDDFAMVLGTADGVAIADIWAGRDPDTTVASAEGLAAGVRARAAGLVAEATGSVEATADWLAERVQPGDVVLVMGGGRSYRIGELLLARLLARPKD
jgi:UDP-N-acetylmuramate--alanine ligase